MGGRAGAAQEGKYLWLAVVGAWEFVPCLASVNAGVVVGERGGRQTGIIIEWRVLRESAGIPPTAAPHTHNTKDSRKGDGRPPPRVGRFCHVSVVRQRRHEVGVAHVGAVEHLGLALHLKGSWGWCAYGLWVCRV